MPNTFCFSEKRVDWSINLEKMLGPEYTEFGSVLFYSYDSSGWQKREGFESHTEGPWGDMDVDSSVGDHGRGNVPAG